ncbi:MAG: MerR family transcriptional regulator, partial [Roseiflexaceae bacterium]
MYLRTKDLAQAVHVSVQQVRNYEASGCMPAVERSPSGYRRYTRQHLVALKTARQLIGGYGWTLAQQIMQAVHQGKRAHALGLIDERHAELARTRGQLEQTLTALTILAHLPSDIHAHVSERVRVGAAARLVGVRVSALRFWEQQGLLQPIRENGSKYRLYDQQQLRRLRIVALLRQANY